MKKRLIIIVLIVMGLTVPAFSLKSDNDTAKGKHLREYLREVRRNMRRELMRERRGETGEKARDVRYNSGRTGSGKG